MFPLPPHLPTPSCCGWICYSVAECQIRLDTDHKRKRATRPTHTRPQELFLGPDLPEPQTSIVFTKLGPSLTPTNLSRNITKISLWSNSKVTECMHLSWQVPRGVSLSLKCLNTNYPPPKTSHTPKGRSKLDHPLARIIPFTSISLYRTTQFTRGVKIVSYILMIHKG